MADAEVPHRLQQPELAGFTLEPTGREVLARAAADDTGAIVGPSSSAVRGGTVRKAQPGRQQQRHVVEDEVEQDGRHVGGVVVGGAGRMMQSTLGASSLVDLNALTAFLPKSLPSDVLKSLCCQTCRSARYRPNRSITCRSTRSSLLVYIGVVCARMPCPHAQAR